VKQNLKVLIIGIDSSIISDLMFRLNELGWEIHGTSRRPMSKHKNKLTTYYLDVSSIESVNGFFTLIALQRFDLVVSAIGITSGISLEQDTPSHIEYTLRVNLTSQLWMLPHIVNSLKENGIAIFLGSSAAEGESFDLTYSAAKAGLRAAISSFSKTRELGEKRIFVLEPSLIEESTMYKEMTAANVLNHRRKWNGSLLKKNDLSEAIIRLTIDKKQKETVKKIRPEGFK
jgi:NAD(P)-dependent dehydrogenase (short-subunit alcohol dehydrogenase family)